MYILLLVVVNINLLHIFHSLVYVLCIPGSKRTHPGSGEEEEEEEEDQSKQEEIWPLREVVFVDPPLSSAPVGVIKKLDGLYAAVLFPSSAKDKELSEESKEEDEKESMLRRCRLLRKDDLIVRTVIHVHVFPHTCTYLQLI